MTLLVRLVRVLPGLELLVLLTLLASVEELLLLRVLELHLAGHCLIGWELLGLGVVGFHNRKFIIIIEEIDGDLDID